MATMTPALSLLCPSCDHANPEGSKFCNACGMPVGFWECALCQTINGGGTNFCYRCGNSRLTPPLPVSVCEALREPAPEAPVSVAVEEGPATSAVRRRRPATAVAVVGVCLAAAAVPAYIAYQEAKHVRLVPSTTPAKTETVSETNLTAPPSTVEASAAAAGPPVSDGSASEAPPLPSTTGGTGASPTESKAAPKKKATPRQVQAKSKRAKETGTPRKK